MTIHQPGPVAMSRGTAFVEGEFVPLAEATVPMLDRGFLRSDATYDVVHVWQGRYFRLDDHLDRFERSAGALRMTLPLAREEIVAALTGCVQRSGLADAYVQMTLTRGVPPPGTRDPRLCQNRFSAFAQPFVWIANAAQREQGLAMIVSETQRIPPEAVDPRIKNFHWLDFTRSIYEAADAGADVAILPDRDGNVTEGAGFNIFARFGRTLVTPDRGVFEGITRLSMIELAPELQLAVAERALPADELRRADEVFITSTAGGVMPVTRLDGAVLGDGAPGPVTRALHDLYWQRHAEGWHATPV
ncbi:aminotransferase class IV [Elioraea sp.]|uniref:aminotransferase class IV n=1 Tax=Elioraea sp. TaxID=2185103 RepID=UPI0025B8DB19|nr:aminotransferase class IV [Elioraea sp.]